jgi:hypothetical protein
MDDRVRIREAALASFELTGPRAGDVLAGVLKESGKAVDDSLSTLRQASVSRGMIVGSMVEDPRLRYVDRGLLIRSSLLNCT